MRSLKFILLATSLIAMASGASCGSGSAHNNDAASGNDAGAVGQAGGAGGQGGLDDFGAGGDGGGDETGVGGAGGDMPLACSHHAAVANTLFTDFEYLTTVPTLSFTTPDGFNGKFFGDDMVNAANFAVATGNDAHGPGHALSISTPSTGFVELGEAFNQNAGCLDLSAFTGITFWAKGAGTLTLKITDGSGMQMLGDLTDTYTQFTVPWTQLRNFSPPVLSRRAGRNLLFVVTGSTLNDSPASLFLDDISFVPPDL